VKNNYDHNSNSTNAIKSFEIDLVLSGAEGWFLSGVEGWFLSGVEGALSEVDGAIHKDGVLERGLLTI